MNTTERELLERCKEFIDAQWVGGAVDLSDAIEAYLAKPMQVTINQYEQAIDDELVNSFLGTKDDFKDAKSALLAIIDWTRQVALDPAVSPEAAKLLEQAKPVQEPVGTVRQTNGCTYVEWNHIPPEAGTVCYAAPQSLEQPPLVQIASDIMGACMNGDLSAKWEDVADLIVANNFDGLSKLTQSLEPMSEDAIEGVFIKYYDGEDSLMYGDVHDFVRVIESHHGIK
jgi:hypothetical protein